MRRSPAEHDLGFTLIEVVVAVAVIAALVGAGFGISLASRSFAVSSALNEFDHFLDNARTIARETAGATLVFAPDAYGDGTEVRVMAPGPNGTLLATMMPIMHTRAAIQESESLGQTPFAFVVHTGGALGGRPGFRLGDSTLSAEVGCPPSGHFHFVIRSGGASGERYVPCRIDMAATRPASFTTWPPATVAPAPTPCPGTCGGGVLPPPPTSSPTCPPAYTPTPGGCTPATPNSAAPNYHVTASVASATMTVGGTDTIIAQATLTNAASAPPGTPPTVSVMIQTSSATCSSTPPGSQPSGSTFTLAGVSPGTCTATVNADTSGVVGATSDSHTITVAIIGPSPTPSPKACDLTASGKCYQRIVTRASQTFWKTVAPAVQCGDVNGSNSCWYVDAIQQISITPGYVIQALAPPVDTQHELLFELYSVATVFNDCHPFSDFSTAIPGSFVWSGVGVGAPSTISDGFGDPSTFLSTNYVLVSGTIDGITAVPRWTQQTTLSQLYGAVANRTVGTPYRFTFSDSSLGNSAPQWVPDFPSCDAAGDSSNPGVTEYGDSGVGVVFDVYQAIP